VQFAWQLNGFDQQFLDTYERVDATAYDERGATPHQFAVHVTSWNRDDDPGV
jgi:hypothetical protein